MRVRFDIPPTPSRPSAFGTYWLRSFFLPPPSSRYEINVLANTYVRLVDAALVEYEDGCHCLRQFWSSDGAVDLGAMHRSVSHFESCISSMNRAINCFRRLRGDRQGDPIALALKAGRVAFAADAIADRVRGMRNEIHHLENSVLSGLLKPGQSSALRAEGLEVAHPTETNQTIKTIDHLVIGSHQITFRELVEWLTEMSEVVVRIVEVSPAQSKHTPPPETA